MILSQWEKHPKKKLKLFHEELNINLVIWVPFIYHM